MNRFHRQPGRIPIPLNRRLKLLRERVLPLVMFLVLVGVITQLWRDHVLPVELIGEVQGLRAEVVVPSAGQVLQVHVRSFERVRHGDPVAVVMTTEPALLESQLAVIRAEVELLRHSLDPVIGRQRTDLDYERLRLELMSQRVSLATAEVRQVHAENDLQRAMQLRADDLIPVAEFEQVLTERDALLAEVAGRSRIVDTLQDELARLRLPPAGGPEGPLRAAINLHEQRLRLVEAELGPVTLRAPLDGMVGTILRNAGEHVVAGEPLMTVMAETSDRIVAYMRQPLRVRPEIGMPVRVQAPTRAGGAGLGEVLHVAAQLEPLPVTMLAPGMRPEMALTLVISLPEGIRAMPGERLNLSLLP